MLFGRVVPVSVVIRPQGGGRRRAGDRECRGSPDERPGSCSTPHAAACVPWLASSSTSSSRAARARGTKRCRVLSTARSVSAAEEQ